MLYIEHNDTDVVHLYIKEIRYLAVIQLSYIVIKA